MQFNRPTPVTAILMPNTCETRKEKIFYYFLGIGYTDISKKQRYNSTTGILTPEI